MADLTISQELLLLYTIIAALYLFIHGYWYLQVKLFKAVGFTDEDIDDMVTTPFFVPMLLMYNIYIAYYLLKSIKNK